MKKSVLLSVIAVVIVLVGAFLFPKNEGGDQQYIDTTENITSAYGGTSEVTSEIATLPDETTEKAKDTTMPVTEPEPETTPAETEKLLDEDGWYSSKDEVALYIHTYGKLPGNFITKKEAEKLGWSGGSLEPYAKGKSIGGSHFGNYEGILPEGHNYTECDIDTAGKSSRGAKRIVFSDDGLIYYTDDHYETFTLLYGSEE